MKHLYVVSVPRPYSKPYNPDREITDLVQNQVRHLSLAERHFPKHGQTNVDVHSIKTDLEASDYIRRVTALLHPAGAVKIRSSKNQKAKQQRAASPKTTKGRGRNKR